MKTRTARIPAGLGGCVVTYYLVLIAFFIAAYYPQYRVWGLAVWSYFPVWVRFVLLGMGAVIPPLAWYVEKRAALRSESAADARSGRRHLPLAMLLVFPYAAAFYLLRARAHFLGDGYTVLSLLAKDNPLVKSRELGEALAHIWLKQLIGEGLPAASASFQIISIVSGVALIALIFICSLRLFDHDRDRVLFTLGLGSAGYMLLFFGYVENYSLFVLAVAAYCLAGLLALRNQVNRWLILVPLVLAVFFHILGMTLVPGAMYVLMATTRLGKRVARARVLTKLVMAGLVGVVSVVAFSQYYQAHPFFRFAFVPLLPDRFTVEGYSLFSVKHLADVANLLLMLLPAFLLLMAWVVRMPLRELMKPRGHRFLLVVAVSAIGAVFIFDPKIGMPRDWDLFSFAGVAPAVLVYSVLLGNSKRRPHPGSISVALLSIGLSGLSLGPRVVAQVAPTIAEARFLDYTALDRVKNRNARIILESYYEEQGLQEQMRAEMDEWKQSFPEERMLEEAIGLGKSGDFRGATELLLEAIEINPIYWNAWSVLGASYNSLNKLDSALVCLSIADGLNPYNPRIHNNLAHIYFRQGDYEQAREYWQKSLKRDSLLLGPLVGLDRLELQLGTAERPCRHLAHAAVQAEEEVDILKALVNCYLDYREYERARQVLGVALQKGLDSSYVRELLEKHPQLRR